MASLPGQCPRIDQLHSAPPQEGLHRVRLRQVEDAERTFDALLSILRQPALGQYVRHVEMDRSLSDCRVEPPALISTRKVNDDDRHLLQGAVRDAGFTGKQYDMMMDIVTKKPREYKGCDNSATEDLMHLSQALAALVISVSPNLESFSFPEISTEFESESECYLMLQAFLERANVSPSGLPYLQKLRTIRCLSNKAMILSDERFYENYNLARNLKLVGNLPAIETISVDAIEDREEEIELEPRSTNFKKVRIHHSNYSSMSLAEIIRSCRRLEEFSYSIGGRSSGDDSHPIFQERHLLDALLWHTKSLQVLELDADEEFWDERPAHMQDYEYTVDPDPDYANSTEPLPTSLQDFTAMRRLSIGVKLLIALARASARKNDPQEASFSLVDMLPPNLEYLCIKGYAAGANPKYDVQVSLLMENRQKLPSLNEISGVDAVHAQTLINPLQVGALRGWSDTTIQSQSIAAAGMSSLAAICVEQAPKKHHCNPCVLPVDQAQPVQYKTSLVAEEWKSVV
ncbi:hypothetical protein ETB97_010222 [Aspergillus alliaceus]|uniref:Uncharacterized protein n=1 Tax=Petromyces alliaceus TaxID=209559 RepID=A0A8H6E8F2_PETAA|nr:hypothetical protein ETB97_010222 [Aspergillus burnettii]